MPTLIPQHLRSHSVGKVMGSSLIMHKEPKTPGGFRNSKRIGGAGSHAPAGGAGEQDKEEVNILLKGRGRSFILFQPLMGAALEAGLKNEYLTRGLQMFLFCEMQSYFARGFFSRTLS